MVKRPHGAKHSVHFLTPSMKKLGKSVGRRNSRSVARQVLNHRRIRENVPHQLGRLIRKDMEHVQHQETIYASKRHPWSHEVVLLGRSCEGTGEQLATLLSTVERMRYEKKKESIKTWKDVCRRWLSSNRCMCSHPAPAPECKHEPGSAYRVNSTVQWTCTKAGNKKCMHDYKSVT